MRVPFIAFANDAVIRGELLLSGDRLSDFIPEDSAFEIENVTVEALDDARRIDIETTSITRADLVAITGSGPRGNSARRVRMRPHPARLKAGPFEILGYVHALPSAHPFSGVLRRRVLPVTAAVIRYPFAGRTIELSYDALLVNPTKIEWIEAAPDEALGLSKALPTPSKIGRRAKDMTQEPVV